MNPPPDRSHVRTEHRNERSTQLHRLDVRSCVDLFINDHAAVEQALRGASSALTAFVESLPPRISQGGRLVYVGAGTSGRLGVLDASECPPTFQSDPAQVIGLIAGGDPALRRSSEGREDEPEGAATDLDKLRIGALDTILGIAAGGTTPYVLGALRLAKARGAATGLLTCASGLARPEHCDHFIVLDTGPELLTGSTRLKAGSATKLALNIITTSLFIQLGKVYSNLMVDVRATNDKLRDRAIRILITLAPPLDRAAAATLLDEADGNLKVAIVMQRLGLDRSHAERLLEQHAGRLASILDDA